MDNLQNIKSDEKEIDLFQLAKMLWGKKSFIIKSSVIGLVIGVVIAFSIPREYTTTVTLAPESQTNSVGNIGALAAMAGISLGGTDQNILSSPNLFPTLLSSTPFLTGLFDIKVVDERNSINKTLYSYLNDDHKSIWFSSVLKLPFKLLGFFSKNREDAPLLNTNLMNDKVIFLTKEQTSVLNLLKNSMSINVDKKTSIITLSVSMQNPKISASVADTVSSYLQEYVIKFRTEKARQDLEFSEKLYEESKVNYYLKQQELAAYSDANMGVISAKYGTTRDRLQNEANLAYGVYNQMAQQLQMAKIKVQDTTPVYTIIQPPVEPLIPSAPNRKLIVVGLFFLFGVLACVWFVVKESILKNIK